MANRPSTVASSNSIPGYNYSDETSDPQSTESAVADSPSLGSQPPAGQMAPSAQPEVTRIEVVSGSTTSTTTFVEMNGTRLTIERDANGNITERRVQDGNDIEIISGSDVSVQRFPNTSSTATRNAAAGFATTSSAMVAKHYPNSTLTTTPAPEVSPAPREAE